MSVLLRLDVTCFTSLIGRIQHTLAFYHYIVLEFKPNAKLLPIDHHNFISSNGISNTPTEGYFILSGIIVIIDIIRDQYPVF